jgi:hypothetical protein
MADQKVEVDKRLVWITRRISEMCPHIKKDKLQKSLANKDSVVILEDFFTGGEPLLLINGDTGAPATEMPERLPKNKWIYFLKTDGSADLPDENISDAITFGEMARKYKNNVQYIKSPPFICFNFFSLYSSILPTSPLPPQF